MKLQPKIYAKTLLSSLESDPSKSKEIAQKFWYFLQKNGQGKDLSKIIEILDSENAENSGLVLAKVYSENPISEDKITQISAKVQNKFGKPAKIQNILKNNITGIIVKVNDIEIDLSLEGKIQQLRQNLIRKGMEI